MFTLYIVARAIVAMIAGMLWLMAGAVWVILWALVNTVQVLVTAYAAARTPDKELS